jgi:hypothetical protein
MKFKLFLAFSFSAIVFCADAARADLIFWNFGNSIAANSVVAAPYGPTTVASGVSASSIQFESGWTVVNQQVNARLGSNPLTIGSQTFNSDSTGTYAAVVDDNFTRSQFQVVNEGDSRNNVGPGKGMLQLLTPGSNISDIAESRTGNLGFGFTVTASDSHLDFSSLVLQAARFNSNPERSWERIALYADSGSGQILVGTSGATPLSNTLAPVTFNLTSLARLTDGSNLTFRLYGDNGTNGDSSFGRELWIDDIRLNGTVTAVPEPSSLVLAGIACGVGAFARRRRKNHDPSSPAMKTT